MESNLQDKLEKLKDIKGLVTIEDHSLYIFILIVLFITLMVSFIVYLLLKPKKRYKKSEKRLAYERLKNLDFSDSKKALYTVSLDGVKFVNDENRQLFDQIEKEALEYKYKKETKELKDDLKDKILKFISTIEVVK